MSQQQGKKNAPLCCFPITNICGYFSKTEANSLTCKFESLFALFFFFYACRSSTTTVTLGLTSYLISSSAETCLHVYLCPLSQISVTPCDAASELLTKSYSCRRKLDCTCFTLLYQMFQNPAQSSISFFFDYSTAFLHFFPIRMLF